MLGRCLAREHPVDADVVVPVPDSGVPAATGFAEASGIPLKIGLIRNHYVGRTFIEPSQAIRDFGVKLKLNPVRSLMEGRRVVLVDDSIVRGTTSRKIVRIVREAGAREVHMRISCPPTLSPCFYGVDTPTRKELIAATHTVEEIREYLGADTLGYLSIEGSVARSTTPRGYSAWHVTRANIPRQFRSHSSRYGIGIDKMESPEKNLRARLSRNGRRKRAAPRSRNIRKPRGTLSARC